jgi:hypothetical protein
MRHRLIAVAGLLVATCVAAWAADFVVEDWKQHPVGTKGLPPGWEKQQWGSPKYDFVIAEQDGRRVLHMKSKNEGSTIAKDVKGKVNLKDTPILEWSWKAVTLPQGGDSCKKAVDDQAAQVFVVWPRFPEAVRSQIIGYVWDATAPVGTTCKSEKTGTVTYMVLRSGTADLNKWVTERRNVRDDFKKIYGSDPDNPGAVSVAIDSNDTQSTAESFVGAITFRKP